MNQNGTESPPAVEDRPTDPARPGLPLEVLQRAQSLYDDGLCRQAFDLVAAVAPFGRFRDVESAILAGRLAYNLGAPRLAFRQHTRALHLAPASIRAQAYYLEVCLALRGPVLAWERFRRFEQDLQPRADEGPDQDGWEYLFTLGARICGLLRDFERAEEWLKRADQHPSGTPWALLERATLLSLREQWTESLNLCRQARELRPWYRPAIQQLAACLHTLDRDDEALELLTAAAGRIESVAVVNQLASLQMDRARYVEALHTLDQAERLSPILDRVNQKWIAAQRCRAACALGEHAAAARWAAQVDDDYHRRLDARLHRATVGTRRVEIPIPFIQQFRLTCVPATLTMLCRHWKLPAHQVEVAEAICYDGTPSHRARQWAEANGLVTREFTLNWDLALALLDRGIPFAVYTTEATSAHIQVVAGYDELRAVLIVRNPAFPLIQEVIAEQFLAHYAATGPAGLVAVPAGEEARLEGLSFPDAALYDGLRSVQRALEEHRCNDAAAHFAGLQSQAPGHWLTFTAGRALYSYDTNAPALLECLNGLLALFPKDGNLLLAKLGVMREIGRRAEWLAFLRDLCARPEADPVFQQQLAQELMADARQDCETQVALKRTLRLQPFNAFSIGTQANFLWSQRRFDEALDLYRFAACLDETKEPAAGTYFAAANACRKTELALEFLRERWRRLGSKAPGPFLTRFQALHQLGRAREAVTELEEVLGSEACPGEIWLAAADAFARQGSLERAEQCLAAAQGRVQRTALLKVKADLARYHTDSKTAVALWREVLEVEPLSVPVHRSLVWVLAESEGRAAALEHLQTVCDRFPQHYQLHQLWSEWAREAGPEPGELVARRLVSIHPADAWGRRQLALVLWDASQFEAALAEAEEGVRLAPRQAPSLATRALVRWHLGRVDDAREDYRQAIRLSVDFAPAIFSLVNSFPTIAERRQALPFVETELVRQTVFGDGLHAYRDAARLNLEPEVLLASLRIALRERPDLAAAWSVVVQQLATMVQLDEALSLARDAAGRFPLHEPAWIDLSTVQRLRLDGDGERSALEQAMRIAPTSSLAARMLAQFHERHGDIARAQELLEQACVRAPLDAVSHGSLAVLLWRRGQPPAAMERMRHAIQVQPGYTWGWQTLGAWAGVIGQPSLAEDLARDLVLRRPGEVRSLLVLAHLLAARQHSEEALRVVDQAIQRFARNPEAHELRAELLDTLGRPAEADAACEPAVFGTRPPAGLRACRARLEARRGNHVSAIDRMRAVLVDNPGYTDGWHQLADWLWQQQRPEEAVAAITNLRRLEPLNPVPLGYRASMKLQQGDRVGARFDFERALTYEPSYAFAALNLFEMQLADGDPEGAGRTLDLIRLYVGGEKAKACEVRWRAKAAIVPPKLTSAPGAAAPQPHAHHLEEAFARLKELCSAPTSAGADIEAALKALLEAGQAKRVDEFLAQLILIPDSNPAVGEWWMRRRTERGRWYGTRAVSRLCPQSEAARRAVTTQIESLGHRRALDSGRNGSVFVAVEKGGRSLVLRWLAWRHRAWIRGHNVGWACLGYAWTALDRPGAVIRWMRDWRGRSGLRMWMLNNLCLALRARRRWREAVEVITFALKLPERDHGFEGLRLLLALELALDGKTSEATAHLREIEAASRSGAMASRYRLARAVVAVQQIPPAERKRIFASERAALRQWMAQPNQARVPADQRRCLIRMCRDAGQNWRIPLVWMGL